MDMSQEEKKLASTSTAKAPTDACSLNSLPDELLAKSFEHVVVDDGENGCNLDGAFLALKLSHVSRRFRRMALSTTTLWTSFTHDARLRSMDFIDACLARSGSRRDLDITVTVATKPEQRGGVSATDFLHTVSAHANRWRSLRVSHTRDMVQSGDLSEIFSWMQGDLFDCPGLETLRLQLPPGLAELTADYPVIHKFWMDRLSFVSVPYPALQYLSLHNILPLCMGTFELVSFLEISLEGHFSVSIARALLDCPSLETFRLTLRLIHNRRENTLHPPPSFPSVRTLEYSIFVSGEEVRDIELAFRQLRFENATNMKLHLEYLYPETAEAVGPREGADPPSDEEDKDGDSTIEFRMFVEGIIPQNHYPSLETLSISFSAQLKNASSRIALTIFPLEYLPKLRHLNISSDLQVLPYEHQFLGNVAYVFPALRTINFGGARVRTESWVGHLVATLRRQGDWESFECLNVPAQVSLYEVAPGATEDEIP